MYYTCSTDQNPRAKVLNMMKYRAPTAEEANKDFFIPTFRAFFNCPPYLDGKRESLTVNALRGGEEGEGEGEGEGGGREGGGREGGGG